MENYIVLAILAVILIAAIVYIVRAKKKGVKCVGCPNSGTCSKNTQNTTCSCGCNNQE